MKTLLYAFVFASLIFFIIDFIWLSIAVKAFYKPHIGSLLNDKPVIWAAIVFYLVYSIGLTLLVLKPGLVSESLFQVFLNGVIFGIVTYGTYNLTNMATIKDWSINVVVVDMIWGGLLTGFSSFVSIALVKNFFTS
tara:strand:- start:152 stop:559 length:408 start_codon:yes stop_codon:yes gene_type:complete